MTDTSTKTTKNILAKTINLKMIVILTTTKLMRKMSMMTKMITITHPKIVMMIHKKK